MMGLSISANGGDGLAGLLRQARPAKLPENGAAVTEPASTAVSLRPLGRSGIDSTGSGTAQISAALTVYLSKLGGTDEPAASSSPPGKSPPAAMVRSLGTAGQSGAAELLHVLDAYGSGRRLSA